MANKSSLSNEDINRILESSHFKKKMDSIKGWTLENLFDGFSFSDKDVNDLRQAINDNKVNNHEDWTPKWDIIFSRYNISVD